MDDLPVMSGSAARLLAEDREAADALPPPEREAAVVAAMDRVRTKIDASLTPRSATAIPDAGPASLTSAWRSKIVLFLAGATLFGAGVAVGRLSSPPASHVDARPLVRSVTSPAPPATTATAPQAPAPTSPEATNALEARPSTPPRVTPREPPHTDTAPSGDPRLAAERALIDRARRALQAGRPADALEAIHEHRALTRNGGQLDEERDALEVHALAAAGRADEASAAASRFREHYPASSFTFPR